MKRWSHNGPHRLFTEDYTPKMMEHDTWELTPYPTYHGTPLAPDQLLSDLLLPAQSMTRHSGAPAAGHGRYAVCTSRRPYPFPAIRSLFHHRQSALQNNLPDFYLSRAVNRRGEPHIFVGATALRLLIANEAKGYIFGCDGRYSKPNPLREDIEEFRGPPMRWLICCQVDTSELPPDLYVLEDESPACAWNFIAAYKASSETPERIAQDHIELMTFKDLTTLVREKS